MGPVLLKKLHVLSALEVHRFTGKVLKNPETLASQDYRTTSTGVTGIARPTVAQTLAGYEFLYVSQASLLLRVDDSR